MKLNFKYIIVGVSSFLFIVNIAFCVMINNLGDTIKKSEKDTATLAVQNQELERKLFTMSSRQNLSLQAEILGFTKTADPIYLDSLKYAHLR